MEKIEIIKFNKINKMLKEPSNEIEYFTPITSIDLIVMQHAMQNNKIDFNIVDKTELYKIDTLSEKGQNYLYEKLKYNNVETIKKEKANQKNETNNNN